VVSESKTSANGRTLQEERKNKIGTFRVFIHVSPFHPSPGFIDTSWSHVIVLIIIELPPEVLVSSITSEPFNQMSQDQPSDN
jgi:hypothetical protein